MQDESTFMMSRLIFHEMRNVSDNSRRQNEKYTFHVKYTLSENCAVYKIMTKNTTQPCRSQPNIAKCMPANYANMQIVMLIYCLDLRVLYFFVYKL
jgi:hypothetical protein